MASTLVNVALSNVKPPHASFYGAIEDTNPVVAAFNREIKEIKAYFARKAAGVIQNGEACSRGSVYICSYYWQR